MPSIRRPRALTVLMLTGQDSPLLRAGTIDLCGCHGEAVQTNPLKTSFPGLSLFGCGTGFEPVTFSYEPDELRVLHPA